VAALVYNEDMKWMILIGGLMAGTLTLAFMTPDARNGDLLSFEPLKEVFAKGSFLETLQEKTPSRVITVTGNSAAHVAGKALGSASKVAGPVIDNAKDEGKESASSLIPKTNEQKRDEIIGTLEQKISDLEKANFEETEQLQQEMEKLVQELKIVQENNSFLQSLVDKITPSDDACECALDEDR